MGKETDPWKMNYMQLKKFILNNCHQDTAGVTKAANGGLRELKRVYGHVLIEQGYPEDGPAADTAEPGGDSSSGGASNNVPSRNSPAAPPASGSQAPPPSSVSQASPPSSGSQAPRPSSGSSSNWQNNAAVRSRAAAAAVAENNSTPAVAGRPWETDRMSSATNATLTGAEPGRANMMGGDGSELIQMINALQDIFDEVPGLGMSELPKIAAVGGQSAGKSSVLESIVGISFLPRSKGMCTKRPLMIRLVRSKHQREYAVFGHAIDGIVGKEFDDFDAVRDEVEAETARLCGEFDVNSTPIKLTIFSPNVITMTLVDLPGYTEVSAVGQPANTHLRIRDMVDNYIKEDNVIILAVEKADNDIAGSAAMGAVLRMGTKAEPRKAFGRTIGVFTKIDMIDGGDCRDQLNGKHFELEHGFLAVKLRGPYDYAVKGDKASGQVSLRGCRKIEEDFINERSFYQEYKHQLGVPNLEKRLAEVLTDFIRDTIPDMRIKIQKKLEDNKTELQALGGDQNPTTAQKVMEMEGIIDRVKDYYDKCVDGKAMGERVDIGHDIQNSFEKVLTQDVQNALDTTWEAFIIEFPDIVKYSHGAGATLNEFDQERIVEAMAIRSAISFKDPCTKCVLRTQDLLNGLIQALPCKELALYPTLHAVIVQVGADMLRELKEDTDKLIEDILEMEKDMNYTHPGFQKDKLKILEMDTSYGDPDHPMTDEEKTYRIRVLEEVFDTLDIDKTGELEEDELRQWAENASKSHAFAGLFRSMDADKSKTISKQEWINFNAQVHVFELNRMDRDDYQTYVANFLSANSSRSIADITEALSSEQLDGASSLSNTDHIIKTKKIAEAYADLMKNHINYVVPKAIMTKMVRESKGRFRHQIRKKIVNMKEQDENEGDTANRLLEEDPAKKARCEELRKEVDALQAAMDQMNSVLKK